jgi:hypothetical protein
VDRSRPTLNLPVSSFPGAGQTHAPYGDWGGFIVFAGGNLEKYKTIEGHLVKFGTDQPTSDIREALPPSTRILESPLNNKEPLTLARCLMATKPIAKLAFEFLTMASLHRRVIRWPARRRRGLR